MQIQVCHFPPGTSKWNKIEHRLFCFITEQLARQAAASSLEVIINLIAATTTRTGLEVYAQLDERTYPDKIRVTDAELDTLNIDRRRVPPRVELHHQATRTLICSASRE